ncbi:MAG: thiamine pyrophosphate-dependent enzyme [Acidobacteriota bacterium]
MSDAPSVLAPRPTTRLRGLRSRLRAFVLERHPFAIVAVSHAAEVAAEQVPEGERTEVIEALRPLLREALLDRLEKLPVQDIPDPTPRTSALGRLASATESLLLDVDGFLCREGVVSTFTADERREMLAGMILTRAVDNRLKHFFAAGDVRFEDRAFQGKGFRSLGQEAIYASCLRLRRGELYSKDGRWRGDVIAPLIRDAGAALAMAPGSGMVRGILSAQMGKAGPPMDGRDLHIGDLESGVLPPAAPLSISSLNVAGLAYAMAQEDEGRVAVSFIGEGGTSLGEWHEAINACAVKRLPAVFCIQNNHTALSTPVGDQSSARLFAEKGVGYGVPAVTLDGTDPEAVAAAFTWAADRARAGDGPTLIELVCMRMCGHAHHDDMLYLGKEPAPSRNYPPLMPSGYADAEAWEYWSTRDPIQRYTERLEAEGVVAAGEVEKWWEEAEQMVEEQAKAVIDAPWPDPETVTERVYASGPVPGRRELLDPRPAVEPGLPEVEEAPPFHPRGRTLLDAVQMGVGDALRSDPRVFVYGEDVGGEYGNAFLLLRPLLEAFGDRLVNSPLSEGATLGVATGAALGGLRPIAEIQFNDFIATGFNQLVNNAAKIRYRWGAEVPMVVRMPWGGLRSAGPYHSQNTEPWFYRTPGLKIVAPSTPADARALLAAAVLDPDPVLFYEHIALYRDPKIKQRLLDEPPEPLPLGRAALRRAGDDLLIVSYGAYVHVAMRVAERLAESGVDAAVLDLRSLAPLDRDTLLAAAAHCNRVLVVHEDTRTGSIGESVAAIIQEEVFEYLDAPVRVIGALDTPVPYAPSLERAFLPSEDEILRAAELLAAY